MKETIVKSQSELDNIPEDFDGRIVIEFGTHNERAVVSRNYKHPVEVRGDSFVIARGESYVVARGKSCVIASESSNVFAYRNSHVSACGNSHVVAYENSRVFARGNSNVVAHENSRVEALESSSVEAHGYSSVVAWGNSSVEAHENSHVAAHESSYVAAQSNSIVAAQDTAYVVASGVSIVVANAYCYVAAYGSSHVAAYGNSSVLAKDSSSVAAYGASLVEAHGSSSVQAHDSSTVAAYENSSVTAHEGSSIEAWGNVQVTDLTESHKVIMHGNSRIVRLPKTVTDFIDFYGLAYEDSKVRLFKAVRKKDGRYYSDRDSSFEYVIGGIATADDLTENPNIICDHGIHMASKEWAVEYGREWCDLAILEVEADIDKIVVPVNGSGKVRADQVKVIREVPLEECGLTGKMLLRKHAS